MEVDPDADDEGAAAKRIEEYFFEPRAWPLGYVDPMQRDAAIHRMRRMELPATAPSPRAAIPEHAALSTMDWTSIGPRPIRAPAGPIGYAGRVTGLVVDPGNPKLVYAGTAGGGLWKTADAGVNWNPLSEQWDSLKVTAVAMAPTSPTTLYVGTLDACLYKTSDAGVIWSRIMAPCAVPGTGTFWIHAAAVDPANTANVLVATGAGLWRSADAGATWQKVGPSSANHLFWDPGNSRHVYSAGPAGVAVSSDGGLTWTPTNGSGAAALPTAKPVDFAGSPSNPLVLYAATKDDKSSPLFFRTNDGGQTWKRIANPSGDVINYWAWTLAVHPSNPNVVYAGCLTLHRSMDGGTTWQDVSVGPNVSGSPLHVDIQSLAFATGGAKLYVGEDGGAWSTDDPLALPIAWHDINETFTTAMFYPGISIDPRNLNRGFGGTQDISTAQYSGALQWKNVRCGDGGWTAINPLNPSIVYAACAGEIRLNKSLDGGATWTVLDASAMQNDAYLFAPPLVMDPSLPETLYFVTNRIWQTQDGGGKWQPISIPLAGGAALRTAAVAPSDSNTVYIGALGKIFVTRNGLQGAASTWTDSSQGLPNRAIQQIAVDYLDPLTAYAAISGTTSVDHGGHIYETKDGGSSWVDTGGATLPDISVNDLVLDPDVAGTIYAATDIGVFRSLDGGASWLPLGRGIPKLIVMSLKLHRATRTLRAATYGRGMWDLSVGQSSVTALTPSATNLNLGDTLTLTATVTGVGKVPTGGVTFTGIPSPPATASLDSGGNAAYTTNPLPAATYSVAAAYGGDGTYGPSGSLVVGVAVSQGAAAATLTADAAQIASGQSVMLTAQVRAADGIPFTPTGSVSFLDGATVLGTAAMDDNATAGFAADMLTDGTHSITAVYAGDTNFFATTSPGVIVQVGALPPGTPENAPAKAPVRGEAALVQAR
jgi:photosystem II stability/assembly factor-like uncharacterized protein